MAFDRLIKIMSRKTTKNASGERVVSFAELVETWAEKVYKRGGEQTNAAQMVGTTTETFRIRYRTGISQTSAVDYNGERYFVKSIQEENRKQFLILECEKKDSE
jgi:SPP1 family predicted phage head-tail adaptor